ncbi:MAG: cyclic nucleotide-binding domain-containing protein [Alphaproteobacteria bacterium]
MGTTGETIVRKTFEAGTEIFIEGDEGDIAYVIESGQVAISKDIDGRDIVLGTVGPQGVFGEMALLDNMPRMATATALEDTVCVCVPADVFRREMKKADALMNALVIGLINNLRNAPAFIARSLEVLAEATSGADEAQSERGLRDAVRRVIRESR